MLGATGPSLLVVSVLTAPQAARATNKALRAYREARVRAQHRQSLVKPLLFSFLVTNSHAGAMDGKPSVGGDRCDRVM